MVFFKKKGAGVHGTVRWTGTYRYQDKKQNYNFAALGIETVSCAMPYLAEKVHVHVLYVALMVTLRM